MPGYLKIEPAPRNHLVLEQVDRDAGAASSLLIFTYFTLGSVGMWIISLEWADKIGVQGAVAVVCGVFVPGAWMGVQRVVGER